MADSIPTPIPTPTRTPPNPAAPPVNAARTTVNRARRAASAVRWWAAAFGLLAATLAGAQGAIQLHYQDRPPYSEGAADGHVRGLVADPAARAFARAGVGFSWVKTPSQRQLALIQAGDGMHCGVGWFRNPQRDALGRFTRAIYQDQPFVALARRDTALRAERGLVALLGDPSLMLLLKDGYSYGPTVDTQLAQHPGPIQRTSAEAAQMLRMLDAGRADWMIVAPEEAAVMLAAEGITHHLQLVTLPGIGTGSSRHIYCNRAVPESVMTRLNRAIGDG